MTVRAELAGLNILLVEDDEGLRAVLACLLRGAGATVLAAEDAEQAVALLSAESVDLVLTDLQLPGRSGIWLSEWILARMPSLPVVLMSAAWAASDTVFPASVRQFVRKPFSVAPLLALLVQTARPSP